jgi:hypothetical protein
VDQRGSPAAASSSWRLGVSTARGSLAGERERGQRAPRMSGEAAVGAAGRSSHACPLPTREGAGEQARWGRGRERAREGKGRQANTKTKRLGCLGRAWDAPLSLSLSSASPLRLLWLCSCGPRLPPPRGSKRFCYCLGERARGREVSCVSFLVFSLLSTALVFILSSRFV